MSTQSSVQVVAYRGVYREDFYWERVDRSLGWLTPDGTPDLDKKEMEKLRDSTVGIAGCGGMGGGVASRLIRLGVGSKNGLIKVADPEVFDISNLNRQAACSVDTIGKNKAVTTAEMAFNVTKDANLEAYPQGITLETVEQFAEGCDVVLDLMELYQLPNRVALHRACRERGIPILNVDVVGLGNRVFLFTPTSMTLEEFQEISGKQKLDDENIMQYVARWAPEMPLDISLDKVKRWVVDMKKAPILSTSPAQGEGIITNRVLILLLGWEGVKPWIQAIPPMPGYMMFDAGMWRAHVHYGPWWSKENEKEGP